MKKLLFHQKFFKIVKKALFLRIFLIKQWFNNILFISNPILRFLAHNDILKTSGVTYYLLNTNDVYLSYAIHLASFVLLGALIDFITDIYQKLNLTKNYR